MVRSRSLITTACNMSSLHMYCTAVQMPLMQSVRPIAPSISLIQCYLPNPVLNLCDSVSVTQIDRTFSPPLHPSHNDLSNAIDA